MSASLPTVVYLPPVSDQAFLRNAAELLERLRSESELRGHPLLASLLAITKGEAEDGLRTQAKLVTVRSKKAHKAQEDDGAAMMAQRLACRAVAGA
jgi:hypothetical protein